MRPVFRVFNRRLAAGAVAAVGVMASGAMPTLAAGQYLTIDPAFTQSLYGTSPAFFGGVAFASDGSPLVDECQFSGSPLHKFNIGVTLPAVNGTTTLHSETVLPSNAGCGLVNHPDGTLYSNTGAGLNNLNATTGAFIRTIGSPGNALGITVDPVNNHLVYVAADCRGGTTCTIDSTDPVTNTTVPFAVLPSVESQFVDGITFDPSGAFLFISNRRPSFKVTVLNRAGALVQDVALPREPDGIAFHASPSEFVLVNDNSGDLDRLDFPLNNFALPPTVSTLATGGFRGDLSQVGGDQCDYLTQNGTRYDNGVTTGSDSLVQLCPGFLPGPGVPPPGAGHLTGRAVALTVQVTATGTNATLADTGSVSTDASGTTAAHLASGVVGPVTAGVLNGNVTTSAGPPGQSTADANVASVSIAAGGGIQATGVDATSTTSCAGDSGNTTIASLTVGANVLNVSGIGPNTVVALVGGGEIILNEQIRGSDPSTSSTVLTVNAIHVIIPGTLDVIVSSATSDIHNCPR